MQELMSNPNPENITQKKSTDFQEHDKKRLTQTLPIKDKKIKRNKSGRPQKKKKNISYSKEDQVNNVPEIYQDNQINNIVQELHFAFIDFFSQINEEKGFVYGPECRKKFKKYTHHKWTDKPCWSRQTQQKKLMGICQNNKISPNQILKSVLLDTSIIFAEEFTYELYTIMIVIYKRLISHRNQILDNKLPSFIIDQYLSLEIITFAQQIFNGAEDFYLFSLTFRSSVPACKKMPFVRPTDASAYIKLLFKISKQLDRLIS